MGNQCDLSVLDMVRIFNSLNDQDPTEGEIPKETVKGKNYKFFFCLREKLIYY